MRQVLNRLFCFAVDRRRRVVCQLSGLHGLSTKLERLNNGRSFCVSTELTPDVKIEDSCTYKHRKPYQFVTEDCRDFEQNLFDALSNDKGRVPVSRFITGLKNVGLRVTDPRLQGVFRKLQELQTAAAYSWDEHMATADLHLDRQTFHECVHEGMDVVHMAFTSDLVIPNFSEFTNVIDNIYWDCFTRRHGKVASYIPQLSRYNPDYWGVSLCTIDGQRHSIGDVQVSFSLQSASKAVTYALALTELGPDVVHQYVGQEPSGHSFNYIKLGHGNKPHNPMINAGAIVITSLIKNNSNLADRFDYVINKFGKLTGGEFIGFNNAIFLSERESADRNMALAYYLKENKCFPAGTNLQETMDFYFQLCSTEVNCESASVMAATLANGGICPITGETILDAEAVRNTLSLMHSCGMYDYSGEFAFKVGLPAKSGVSGIIMLVVPNVCGFCLWSPPIDNFGNSARALGFCEELVRTFNFHHFDNLRHLWSEKKDPRANVTHQHSLDVVSLLFSASHGDLNALKRLWLSGKDMETVDYDGRTALHLVAAEGHYECAKFLLEVCGVNPRPFDRWGHTPYDEAIQFNNSAVAELLKIHEDDFCKITMYPKVVASMNHSNLPEHSNNSE